MSERLVEQFRPQTLSQVCGQREAVEVLQAYAAQRTARCLGLIGEPSTGKTSAALAFMTEVGANVPDVYPGMLYKNGSDFTGPQAKDEAKRTYDFLQCCPLYSECRDPAHVHGLVIEECSKMAHDAVEFFKSALEVCLPPRAIVIVTSNDVSRFQDDDIGRAFLDRFEWLEMRDTPEFREAALLRIMRIWQRVLTKPHGVEVPDEDELLRWAGGLNGDGFSMRRILAKCEQRLAVVQHQQNNRSDSHDNPHQSSVCDCDPLSLSEEIGTACA